MLRGTSRWLGVAASCCLLFAGERRGLAQSEAAPRRGQLSVVTYNVAGLPEGLSNVHPQVNLPIIGGLLNKFDLALVQEDFAYPELLRQRLRLPYRSAPFARGNALHFGDGLSLFSKLPLADVERTPWAKCHGILDSYQDCLTPKGLARSRVELAPGVPVDVFDAHFDAGPGAGDVEARRAQLAQLVEAIQKSSGDRALVLGGDFNLGAGELPQFRERLRAIGVVDACDELRCPQRFRIDRVLYRSSAALQLKALGWRVAAGFRDAGGRALSDHEPVVVSLGWVTK